MGPVIYLLGQMNRCRHARDRYGQAHAEMRRLKAAWDDDLLPTVRQRKHAQWSVRKGYIGVPNKETK